MGQPAEKTNLKPAEVVTRWNDAVTVGTLANWRAQGKGPPFIKFGARVRYPISRLEIWEAANMSASNDNEQTKAEVA